MKKLLLSIILFTAISLQAQNITNTLAAGGTFAVKDAVNTFFRISQSNGLLGIGTNVSNPRAQVEIGGTEGLLVTGTINTGTARALGSGLRFHWYPRKGAIRAGMAESSYWDDDGTLYPKLGLYSVAFGYYPRATATASTAIGAYNKATGDYSLALGSYCMASGSHSIAIGTQVIASGIYSIALGAGADTNGKDGSVVIGDDTYFQTAYASADNQITMRFSGGYRFWSSYPDSVSGVYMRHGQSGWSNYCDKNMKENFEPVDGESVLDKISSIPITKWNYKKTDPNEKYVGPVSQDFYSAFHLNGSDSLGINSISIDGINMAGVKALEKRTKELRSEIEELKRLNREIIAENRKLRDEFAEIKNLKGELEEQIRLAKNSAGKDRIIAAK